MRITLLLAAIVACSSVSTGVEAAVVRLEITSRESFAEGAPFGVAGAYERLTAIAHGEVDPRDALNSGIVNLDKATRNASGKVEYDTDVFILRPLDPTRSNGALLYDVNNRGMKLIAGAIMGAVPNAQNPLAGLNDPRTMEDMGDGLLLNLGYTIVWSGWDPNASRAQHGLAMQAPVALDHGAPIERKIRDEFIIGLTPLPSAVFHLSYEAVSGDTGEATLTVRWREAEPGAPIPANRWHFVDSRTVALLPEGTKPEQDAIYELRYRARGSQVAGLGFAATRDLISYLRRAPDSLTPFIRRTLAFGVSQSARYLRGFLAEGFNRDEAHERVFDGVLMHIGGAGKVFLNAEFSQPSRTNTPYSDHFYPDFSFPYSTAPQADPIGEHRQAGILRGDNSDPLCMEINTSTEYWQKAASLISTKMQGTADLVLPPQERAYFLAGLPHAPLAYAQAEVVHPVNMLTPLYVLRALLLRLDAWVARGEEPPASVLPRIDQHTLVSRADLHFPAIANVSAPSSPNSAQRIADWVEPRGASGVQPRVLVPQSDGDGQDLGGLRVPEVDVPLGTYVGWNPLNGDKRAGQMATLIGSFIPFARTRAEREVRHDPRLSLEERYRGKDDYLTRFHRSVEALVTQGFIRPEDADRYIEVAMKVKAFDAQPAF